MVSIHNPSLEVIGVERHPGQRTVRIEYDIVASDGDPMVDAEIYERVQVHGVDLSDAPVAANSRPLATLQTSFRVERGEHHRVVETVLARSALDVEQDWWDTDQAGGTKPIAEFADHLIATLTVSVEGRGIAMATSPVVSGSWGALGDD